MAAKKKPAAKTTTEKTTTRKPRAKKTTTRKPRAKAQAKPKRELCPQMEVITKRLLGKPRSYTPETLGPAAAEYFQFCIDNPILVTDFRGKDVVKVDLPKPRVFTQVGLCVHLGICEDTFRNYSKDARYFEVTRAIKDTIYRNKFEGATAGVYSHNIIARDLGLADKQQIEVKDTKDLTNEELQAELDKLRKELDL